MKHVFLFLLGLIFGFQTCISQSVWLDIDLKNPNIEISRRPIEIINITDDSNGNLAVFFKYSNAIEAHLYDEDKNLVNKLLVKTLPKYSSNYLGSSRLNNIYTLYFENIGSTKFSSLTIDFENLSFSYSNDIGLLIRKETFVESFEDNNKLYFLTSINKTSKLKIYTLFHDNSFESKLIDLSSEIFEKPNKISTNLNVLIKGMGQESMTKSIKTGEPSSLEIASSKNKLYYDKGVITFTSNYFNHCTYVIDINIDDGSYKYSKYDNVNYNKKDLLNKANSFIYDDYFFSMYVSKGGLFYDIYNRKTKTLIKKLELKKDEVITFKNSPIILEGGDFKSYRELDKTSQFIRKVTNSRISTFVHKIDKNYIVTIGSSEPKPQNQTGYYYSGGLVGGLIATVAHELLASSYYSYITTKSSRIECLFDEKFNHIEGKIPVNGFDRIKNYIDEMNLEKAPLQSIFKSEGNYVFGYFNKDVNSYKYIKI